MHFYYIADLLFLKGKSRIFEWSSIEFLDNRFKLTYLRENIETFADSFSHLLGICMFVSCLPTIGLKISCLSIGSILVFYHLILSENYKCKEHMLPSILVKAKRRMSN